MTFWNQIFVVHPREIVEISWEVDTEAAPGGEKEKFNYDFNVDD